MNEKKESQHSHELDGLLTQYGSEIKDNADENIVYGVYDNRGRSFTDRMNDFFIDRSKVSVKDKTYFFYLMAVMIDAGLSVVETLGILGRRSTNERFRRVLNTIAHHVERGQALSKAMGYFPEVFDDAEIAIVRSGEAIGHLDKMLFRLSDQTSRMYDLSLKIKTALVYPILVISTLFVAGGILMFVVIPKLTEIFATSNAKLPLITQIFISISQLFINFWWLILSLVFGGFIFYRVYQNTPKGRLKVDYYRLKIPVIGELIQKLILAKFVNMLEIMVAAGMSIPRILDIISSAIGNEVYRKMITKVKSHVEQGEKISDNLAQAPFLFPEVVTQMIRIGEQSASLDRSADKLAKHFEAEAEHSIRRLTAVFEPFVIILIAIVVALVAFAVLGPIFSLTEVV